MDISDALASHLVKTQYDDLGEHVVEVTKKCVLDTIGVILAANQLGEGCQAFVNVAIAEGGKEESTVFGYGQKLPASATAFVNGSMAHSMDFGESHDTGFVHASSPTVPAAIAVAESLGNVSGKELITAVALGNDLVCRLGLSMTDNLLEYGWYMPPIMGAFGATAAAGKLLQLTEDEMLDAFSLTMCQATCSAEITQNPQTVIRSVRDAFAAKAGVTSALLAKQGVKGFQHPFEGEKGFFFAFARNSYNPDILMEDLGKRFEGAYVSFKPWPSCRGTHPYISMLLDLIAKHQLQSDDVVKMKAVVSKVNQMLLCEPIEAKRNPDGAINAKFSLPYVLATALKYGKVTLEQFLPESIQNPDVLALAQKVEYEVNPDLTMKESLYGYLEVHTRDQNVYTAEVKVPYGHPDRPMTDEEFTQKFIDCSQYAIKNFTEENLHTVINGLQSLESIQNIREITDLL